MKTNQETSTLPALSLPRLSSKLENIADDLGCFAVEFGVEVNENFGPRMATIGFTNGVRLGLYDPKNAARLEELLAAEAVPLPEELAGVTPAFIAAFPGEKDWTHEVAAFLRSQWRKSADDVPGIKPGLEVQLRILHGIRTGLIVSRESPETGAKIQEHIKTLWVENYFLSGLLYIWRDNGWEPCVPPFVEFIGSYYKPGTFERRMICGLVAEIYPIAKALNNPWSLSFWVEMGWSGGRDLARRCPNELRALLDDAPKAELQACQRLYQNYVVGGAGSSGEVQIERAALRFIGELKDADLARCHCTGREPRRLARVIYDFAFWMGIFASHPVPVLET